MPAFGQGGGTVPPASAPAPVTPKLKVQKPTNKRFIRQGWGDRLLLGGTWYFRLDTALQGDRQKFYKQKSLTGWSAITIPHNWNAKDLTQNRSAIGFYRKDFKLPRSHGRKRWKIRFEGANHRTTVYLNGKAIGSHAGGYLPFEVVLKGLKKGHNKLVVRVSTLRSNTDLTHWRRAAFNGFGTGGWWNFGGLIREVYVRPIRAVDIQDVAVIPGLKCAKCSAKVRVRTYLHNYTRSARSTRVVMKLGKRRIQLGTTSVAGRRTKLLNGTFTIRKPKLWKIGKGRMYRASVAAAAAGQITSRYRASFGVRRIDRKKGGIATINGRKMNLRGASLHEDDINTGGASTPTVRRQAVSELKELGANVTRAHYPLHPAMMEALDRAGILYWSDAPVYQVPNVNFTKRSVRKAAVQANIDTVREGINHPSIFAWSVANELEPAITGAQAQFLKGAVNAVKKLDRTRLVALDKANRIGDPQGNPILKRFTAFGLNEYFGWYRASVLPNPPSTDAAASAYLDGIHRYYPRAALFITEFGAEANRNGPVAEKGTFQFQSRWMRTHLGIYASKPYINGALAWALRDFRVNPTWNGGNPKPNPPYNNKSLIEETGAKKPAFSVVQQLYKATRPTR